MYQDVQLAYLLVHAARNAHTRSTGMQIMCMTISAAVEVLILLQDADLRAYRVTGPQPPLPPIHFTFSAAPLAHLIEQLRAIPDTTIVEKEAG